MSDWTHGYVAEIDYTYGFYRELTPTLINFILALRGFAAPPIDGEFSWCELGFGQGMSANLLAAANPNGDFWGTDFNPQHTAGAQRLSARAGLGNTHWFDDSFAQFLERDTPQFDYICLHGIYSWISEENRQVIVEFIRRKLKPGGVVYVSYNTLPGWAWVMPLRQLMSGYVDSLTPAGEPIGRRIDMAIEFAQGLAQHQLGYFQNQPGAAQRLKSLQSQSRQYLAHEYFNRDWNPLYFSQVASEMAAGKLNFAGSAHALDFIDSINFPEGVSQKLDSIRDPIYRETVRDFAVHQSFRRDLFIKGGRRLGVEERRNILLDTRLALQIARDRVPLKVKSSVGELELDPAVYVPILDALAQGVQTLRQLLEHAEIAPLGAMRLIQAAVVMCGAGYVQPAGGVDEVAKRQESVSRFNRAVVDSARGFGQYAYLASAMTGSGVSVSRIQQLFLDAYGKGSGDAAQLAAMAWEAIKAQGQQVIKEGSPLDNDEASLAELSRLAEEFLTMDLPVLRRMLIVE